MELSTAGWEELPEVSREMAIWDFDSRQAYLAEWPLEEDRLAQLARDAVNGQMDAAQRDRYRELLRLVAENRPVLDRFISGGGRG